MEEPRCQPKKKGGLPETRNYEIFTPKNGWLEEELGPFGAFWEPGRCEVFQFQGFLSGKKTPVFKPEKFHHPSDALVFREPHVGACRASVPHHLGGRRLFSCLP